MTRIIIKKLIWDSYNTEHIQKHNLKSEEVEEAVKSIVVHQKTKKGRYIVICRFKSRILSIIVNRKGTGIYYLVTARDAAKKERKRVYEKENK